MAIEVLPLAKQYEPDPQGDYDYIVACLDCRTWVRTESAHYSIPQILADTDSHLSIEQATKIAQLHEDQNSKSHRIHVRPFPRQRTNPNEQIETIFWKEANYPTPDHSKHDITYG